MKYDGFAFEAPEIRESDHDPRVASTVPKTVFETETTRLAVNAADASAGFVNSTDSGAIA